MKVSRRRSHSRSLLVSLALFMGCTASALLLFAADLHAAEACAGGLSELEVLQPGDDESGLGGTGFGPTSMPAELPRAQVARTGDESDSGIGGTGRSLRVPGDDDSGIGGTGVYGTVTRTDRLCVNGLEIEVPDSLALESTASASGALADRSLATGQIVFVFAQRTADGLVARRIVLDEKYAGQIDEIRNGGRILVVSGRRVQLRDDAVRAEGLAKEPLRLGQWISFYGLPDREHTIVTSRLEPGQPEQVLRIGELESGPPVWLEGLRSLEYVSIEGFVTRTGEGLGVARIRLDLGSAQHDRSGLREGARVRVGGRVGADRVLRLAPPPSWLRPPGSETRPRPQSDTPRPPDSPPDRPDTDKDRPKQMKPPRPDRRPRIRPPLPERVEPIRPVDRVRPDIQRR